MNQSYVWMGRFTDKPFQIRSLDQELYSDFMELRTQRETTDGAILAWIASLQEDDLNTVISYTGIASPQLRHDPLWFALAHFFNHQTHHRGQITTLLSQQGIDPGVTDLIALPEFQPAK